MICGNVRCNYIYCINHKGFQIIDRVIPANYIQRIGFVEEKIRILSALKQAERQSHQNAVTDMLYFIDGKAVLGKTAERLMQEGAGAFKVSGFDKIEKLLILYSLKISDRIGRFYVLNTDNCIKAQIEAVGNGIECAAVCRFTISDSTNRGSDCNK